jgi:hypothetical protein
MSMYVIIFTRADLPNYHCIIVKSSLFFATCCAEPLYLDQLYCGVHLHIIWRHSRPHAMHAVQLH